MNTISSRHSIRIDLDQPATLTSDTCLQGKIYVDRSKLREGKRDKDRLVVYLELQRIHEKWQYRSIESAPERFLTCSSKTKRIQCATWSVKDTTLRSFRNQNQKIVLERSKGEKDCAFSLAPALYPSYVKGDKVDSPNQDFIFQLDGRLLDRQHLRPTTTETMEKEYVMLSASLRYTKSSKMRTLATSLISRYGKEKNSENNLSTSSIRGATSYCLIKVPPFGLDEDPNRPPSYALSKKDCLVDDRQIREDDNFK